LEAGRRNDWREAEQALRDAQIGLHAVSRFVQLVNDIQRGHIR
jgi:hypothetical protein